MVCLLMPYSFSALFSWLVHAGSAILIRCRFLLHLLDFQFSFNFRSSSWITWSHTVEDLLDVINCYYFYLVSLSVIVIVPIECVHCWLHHASVLMLCMLFPDGLRNWKVVITFISCHSFVALLDFILAKWVN